MHGGVLTRGYSRGVFRSAPPGAADRKAMPARGPRRRRPRLLLALAAVTAAGLLGAASPALADTTVSLEPRDVGGEFRLFVRDTTSLFDEPMHVDVVEAETEIRISDRVGRVRIDNNEVTDENCRLSGAEVRCNRNLLDGLRLTELRLEGSDRNDVITNSTTLPAAFFGDRGDDLLQGGPRRDRMNGEAGNDTERGGDGVDSFFAEPGNDTLDGEQGEVDNVSYAGASGPVALSLEVGSNPDGVTGESDQLVDVENATGSPFSDSMGGSSKPNALRGGGGKDTLNGLGGDDRLDGGADADVIHGDTGTADLVTYEDRTLRVKVTLDNMNDDGEVGEGDNVRDTVEHVVGGAGNDELVGHTLAVVENLLNGTGGHDRLEGGPGGDRLIGAAGTDLLNGGAGADTLLGGSENDILNGGPQADALDGGTQNDALDGGTDRDLIDGGLDLDHLNYDTRDEPLLVTLDSGGAPDDGGPSDGAPDQRDDARNIEKVTTGKQNDRVVGDGSNEEFITGDGADTIEGNGGDDRLESGPGDDDLFGNDGNDKLIGGPGIDKFFGALGEDKLDTRDGAVDTPISCGEGPIPDPVDTLLPDLADVLANPEVTVPGSEAECENVSFDPNLRL